MTDDFASGWDAASACALAIGVAARAHAADADRRSTQSALSDRLKETRDRLDRALAALRLPMPLAEDEAVYAAYRVEFDAAEALLAEPAPTGEPGAGTG